MSAVRRRVISEMVADCGLALVRLESTSKSHIRAVVKADDGEIKTVFASSTPSDHRASKNIRGEFRRFAKAHQRLPTTPLVDQAVTPTLLAQPLPISIQTTTESTLMTTKSTPATPAVRSALSQVDFFKLCIWVKDFNLSSVANRSDVCTAAGALFGRPTLSASTVGSALEAVGKTWPSYKEGRRSSTGDRTRVVACVLRDLLRELGKEPSTELLLVAAGQPLASDVGGVQ